MIGVTVDPPPLAVTVAVPLESVAASPVEKLTVVAVPSDVPPLSTVMPLPPADTHAVHPMSCQFVPSKLTPTWLLAAIEIVLFPPSVTELPLSVEVPYPVGTVKSTWQPSKVEPPGIVTVTPVAFSSGI
jgi:hypothetical protein